MTEKPTFYSTVMLLYKSGETERRGTGGNEPSHGMGETTGS